MTNLQLKLIAKYSNLLEHSPLPHHYSGECWGNRYRYCGPLIIDFSMKGLWSFQPSRKNVFLSSDKDTVRGPRSMLPLYLLCSKGPGSFSPTKV